MAYTTGIELSRHRRNWKYTKEEALEVVYLVKARQNSGYLKGVLNLPKALIGIRVKLVEVMGEQDTRIYK